MNDDDALPFEMRRLPGSPGSSPPTLDDNTADRLLAGRLDPADAPPGFAAVAIVVRAATAPATAEELAGEPAAVARFAAMARSGARTRAAATRRASAPRRIVSVRLAVAVLAAVLSIGGVAAATGVFPGPAKPPAGHGPGSTGGGGGVPPTTTAAPGRTDTATTTEAERARGGGTAIGPDASGPAKDGLCRAWLAGDGERNGKREDSTAFRALAAAAGGVDRIDAYCKATTPKHPKDKNKNKDKDKGSNPSQGNDDSQGHGSGNGHGGPPPTTD
jgi:hypothetical protein